MWIAVGREGGIIQYRENPDLVVLSEGEFSTTIANIPFVDMTFNASGELVEMPVQTGGSE